MHHCTSPIFWSEKTVDSEGIPTGKEGFPFGKRGAKARQMVTATWCMFDSRRAKWGFILQGGRFPNDFEIYRLPFVSFLLVVLMQSGKRINRDKGCERGVKQHMSGELGNAPCRIHPHLALLKCFSLNLCFESSGCLKCMALPSPGHFLVGT